MTRVTKLGGKAVLATSNKLNLLCFFFHPFRLMDYKKVRGGPPVLNILAAFTLFWLSRRFKSFKRLVPLRSDYYECFFTPNQLKQIIIETGLEPRLFDLNTLYYWGYRTPLPAFSNFTLKMDHFINRFENIKCLKIFGARMVFCSVKGVEKRKGLRKLRV